MAAYIGIDPGQQGAITLIEDITKDKIIIYDMPLLPQKGIDGKELHNLFLSIKRDYKSIFCVLEKAQAMPGQGTEPLVNGGANEVPVESVSEVTDAQAVEIAEKLLVVEFLESQQTRTAKQESFIAEAKKMKVVGVAKQKVDGDKVKKGKDQLYQIVSMLIGLIRANSERSV